MQSSFSKVVGGFRVIDDHEATVDGQGKGKAPLVVEGGLYVGKNLICKGGAQVQGNVTFTESITVFGDLEIANQQTIRESLKVLETAVLKSVVETPQTIQTGAQSFYAENNDEFYIDGSSLVYIYTSENVDSVVFLPPEPLDGFKCEIVKIGVDSTCAIVPLNPNHKIASKTNRITLRKDLVMVKLRYIGIIQSWVY